MMAQWLPDACGRAHGPYLLQSERGHTSWRHQRQLRILPHHTCRPHKTGSSRMEAKAMFPSLPVVTQDERSLPTKDTYPKESWPQEHSR